MDQTETRSSTPEHRRLEEARTGAAPWKAWGPYLTERQWGTVREDYSAGGDAWNHFTHDQARSRAYRWGEDGIAGICDDRQRLCLALALWNGADPILKERMFGLTNGEGNHGEDVKEYWFYLDSTPTHSYLKCQYKYPQRAFPYGDLVATNGAPRQAGLRVRAARHRHLRRGPLLRRGRRVRQGRARRHPDARHRAQPRPGRRRRCTCCRRCGSATRGRGATAAPKPSLSADGRRASRRAAHAELGEWRAARRRGAPLLFCENETNNERLFGAPNASRTRRTRSTTASSTARPTRSTRRARARSAPAHHVLEIPAGGSATVRVAAHAPPTTAERRWAPTSTACSPRAATEADAFYATVIPPALDADARAR